MSKKGSENGGEVKLVEVEEDVEPPKKSTSSLRTLYLFADKVDV